jgi:glycosyltransferase involved in cell wall biosynthesis
VHTFEGCKGVSNKLARILAIVPYFVPRIGGGESHLYQLADLLSEKGYSVTVLTLRLPDTPEWEMCNGTTICRFGSSLSADGRRAGYEQILHYVKVNDFPNTVLYEYLCVGMEHHTALMSKLLTATREKGIPRVVRIPSSGRVTELSRLYPQGLDELRQAHYVIALNPGIHRELIHVGVDESRIKLIPNGVNINMFYPNEDRHHDMLRRNVGCDKTTMVFLCPSRLAFKKKIPDLLRLWKQISVETKNSCHSCDLWVVGDDRLEANRGQVSREIGKLIRSLEFT